MDKVVKQEFIWTIPNMLCLSRIVLSPYIGYLITQEQFRLASAVLALAGVTDFLDGLIARTFPSQSSRLGSFLDPLADKVLITTVFVTLTLSGRLPVPLTVLVVSRDVLLLLAGCYIKVKSLPSPRTLGRLLDLTQTAAQLSPTLISKVNTAVQLITVALTLVTAASDCSCYDFLFYLWCLAGMTTVASAVSYVVAVDSYVVVK